MALNRLPRHDEDLDEDVEEGQQELIPQRPPTWEELAAAHAKEDELRLHWENLKAQTKSAKADYDLAVLILRQLGRRMRASRVNTLTGEVR